MRLFKNTAAAEQHTELVNISLTSLINLAKPAAALKLRQSSINARQSGGFISRFKGRGMEFDEARLYQPGDDIRSIDWRVTARTGRTHTKVFREERERQVFISVDQRAAMHFATRGVFKSVQAAKLAALLAWMAQQHGDRVGGQVYTQRDCREFKPHNGRHAVLRFFNGLLQLPKADTPLTIDLDLVLSRLVHHVRPGSLVYLISDFRGLNAQLETHFARLAQHCDVVLMQLYDPLEAKLPGRGRYRFTDETRDVLVDTGDRQRIEQYQQRFHHHQLYLQKLTKKLRLFFVQCSTVDDPVQVLR